MQKQKAFTLVELLVVMAIIGILIGLSVFGINAALTASRDTQRSADLNNIRIAIEAYRADNQGSIPDTITVAANSVTVGGDTITLQSTINISGATLIGLTDTTTATVADLSGTESILCYDSGADYGLSITKDTPTDLIQLGPGGDCIIN